MKVRPLSLVGRPKKNLEYSRINMLEYKEVLIELIGMELIDESVFYSALKVLLQLKANSFSAPKIFCHGPESVVFTWIEGKTSLSITISVDKISALISIPECILTRIDGNIW